ncbi:MAG: FG-GAP repeat domain-containing protein, partial [Planctomycetota bacterium]
MYARLTVPFVLVFVLVLTVSTPGLCAQEEWAELTDHLRTVNGVFQAAAVADVDGDGKPDLLLGGLQGERLLHNTGNTLYEDWASRLPATPGYTYGLLFFDADGDGDQDLLRMLRRYSTFSGQDRLYLNDGKGNYTDVTTAQLPAMDADTTVAVAGDVDGDKDQDLVISSQLGTLLFLNDGKGKFTDATASNMPNVFRKPKPADLALVDIDGDKDLDLLLATTHSLFRLDVIYTNDGKGKFTDASGTNYQSSFSHKSLHLAATDFDGNGSVDMLLVDNFNFRLLSNDGKGVFTTPKSTVPGFRSSPTDLHVMDIDRDGDQDILLFHRSSQNQVMRNDGGWKFTDISTQVQGLSGLVFNQIVIADVDGDKNQDVIYVSLRNRPEIMLSDAPNSFRNITNHQTPKGSRTFRMARVADMNGDGALDLVTDGGLLLNDGRGIFVPPANSTNLIGTSFSVAVEDFDGDGDKDVYVGLQGQLHPPTVPAQNRLLLNDGKGNLTHAVNNLPVYSDFTKRVHAADIDKDGDMDVLVANSRVGFGTGAPGIRLLINNGKGVFADGTSLLPSQAFNTEEVLAGDVNGDGRVDVVAFDQDRLRLYLQDQAGKFATAHANVPSTIKDLRSGEVGDTDLDGDLDILVGTKTGLVYLFND